MTYDDWIAAGYRRSEVFDRQMNKLADFLLQRRFDDLMGKKYFITVYCYDRMKYPDPHRDMFKDAPIGFMPTAQFVLDKPFFSVEMNAVESLSVGEVEEWFGRFWELTGKPYYEHWETEIISSQIKEDKNGPQG